MDEEVALTPLSDPGFGAYLRAARRAADLSQRELAKKSGVAASTISRIEAGRTSPSLGTFERLLAATSCGVQIVRLPHDADELEPEFLALNDHTVRDAAGRHFPAHLDVREPTKERPWWFQKYNTVGAKDPLVTFDLSRGLRDLRRREDGAGRLDRDERFLFRGEQSEAYIPYYRPKPMAASSVGSDLDWW
jgi:transcriptional regulator with XRE-family HTH domain